MARFLDLLRDHFSGILSGLLLCAALVTLLMAPPKPDFSIANCFLFIGFVTSGSLLLWGLWGPDPIATRLRRESRRRGPSPHNIRVDADGLECRGYVRTVKLRWEDVVALIARKYHLLCAFGILPLGTVYSVYSQRERLSFLERLPDAPERVERKVGPAEGRNGEPPRFLT